MTRLPSVSKVKYLHMQIRLNNAGIQRDPSHSEHFRWESTQRENSWEHWNYPLLDILFLFGFCCSTASSGDLTALHGYDISPPAAVHLQGYITFLFLQDLLKRRKDYCPVQPSQATARGFLSLWSFARHFTDPHVNVIQALSEGVKMLRGVGKKQEKSYHCKTAWVR